MAKKKAAAAEEENLAARIAKITGGDTLSNCKSIRGFIDTGNLAYNHNCSGKYIGGGIPRGRITEIFGPSSSGKSLIASHIMHGCQRFLGGWAVLLDAENAANHIFMEEVCHLDLANLIYYGPGRIDTLEKCFQMINVVAKEIRELEKAQGLERKPIVIIYDSIASSPCERELKETNLPLDYSPGDWKKVVGRNEQPGERAKICSKELRKLSPLLTDLDVSLVVLNQVRDKIGVMYGSPETTAGGGKALEFYASLRMRLQAKKKIENKSLGTFEGINLAMKNVKNRATKPYREADGIKLYFDNGVDPVSGLLECLIKDRRVTMKSAGNFEVAAEYLSEGQTEYKFKASKTENTMPIETILECPKLVDVETREEVEEYLACFSRGLEASESDEYAEKAITFDADGAEVEVSVDAD